MKDNVVLFNGVTRLDLPAERVLQAALDEGLTEVVIIGYDKDGDEYFASNKASGGAVSWHLERAKKLLLETVDK